MKAIRNPITISNAGQDFSIDDIRFKVIANQPIASRQTDQDGVVLGKTWDYFVKPLLEALGGLEVNRMLELGIWRGGSAVLWPLITDLEKYVGIDLRQPAFDFPEAVLNHPRFRTVKLHWAISQDDRDKLMSIVDSEFDGPLDLVIDDASHQYEQSKKSFEILFPKVSAGGFYVIEDWAWAHEESAQQKDHFWAAKPALTNLVFELLMLAGTKNSVIANINIFSQFVIVQRGSEPLDNTFQLSDHILYRDHRLELV